jgi:hypothetical protein
MDCPFKMRCKVAFMTGIIAGSIILESCNSGFHCEYLPHEEPKPKNILRENIKTYTVVASSASPGLEFLDHFVGSDPKRPGHNLYSKTFSVTTFSENDD